MADRVTGLSLKPLENGEEESGAEFCKSKDV